MRRRAGVDVVNAESFAGSVAWLADNIVRAVHGQRQDEITRAVRMARSLTAPAGVDVADALIVALAAACSPDRPVSSQLAWVSAWGDELDRVHETPADVRALWDPQGVEQVAS